MISQTPLQMQQIPISADVSLVHFVYSFVLANRLEFAMFFSAMLGYGILCCTRLPKLNVRDKKDDLLEEQPSYVSVQPTNRMHAPSGSLSQMLKSMWSDKKDVQLIAKEMCTFIQKHPDDCDISKVNDALEELTGILESELMQALFEILPQAGLKHDQRTFEILFKVHVASHDLYEIQALVAEMEAKQMPLSARAVFLVMKGALQGHDFTMALKYFKVLRSSWEAQKTSEALVPQSIMLSLVELASKEDKLSQLVEELRGLPLPEKTIDTMLGKCVGLKGVLVAKALETLARAQRETLPDSTYSMLIKAMSPKPKLANAILEEALAREGSSFSPDLALSMLDFCKNASDADTVDRLLRKMKPKQVNVLAAFVWFYIGAEKFDAACDVYELEIQPLCSPQAIEAGLRESIVDAAVLCGRSQLAERLVVKSRSESTGAFAVITYAGEAFEAGIDFISRWNAMVSYWVVLIF